MRGRSLLDAQQTGLLESRDTQLSGRIAPLRRNSLISLIACHFANFYAMPSAPVSYSLVPRGMLGHPTSSTTEMAHQAFVAAAKRFSSGLDRGGEASELIRTAASMRDVQALIETSKNKYENEKRFPKARKWLGRAASTIHHYGSVIDVFAQISPEYVSLVWGSMKLIVTVSEAEADGPI